MYRQTFNDIAITHFETYEALSSYATDYILDKIKQKPTANVLLPTGTTPLRLYELLSQAPKALFANISCFNFDEYCTKDRQRVTMLDATDQRSYQHFMRHHLFDKLGITNFYFPDEQNVKEEGTYDKLIQQKGGIDLCINALGEDGHTFGFNFPGTSFSSQTRLVTMNSQTKSVNQHLTGEIVPDYAITTGLQTGMKSREILFLVCGKRKAQILRKCLRGSITETLPASILRMHKNCRWLVDKEAASEL